MENKLDVEETRKSWDDYFKEFKDGRPIVEKILDKIDISLSYGSSNSMVLDAGCGDGKYSFYINGKGYTTIGIDYSLEGIKVAQEKINSSNNIEFRCMRIDEDLPFKDETFDFVYCINVIHCLYDEKRQLVLSEMKRVLKRNGILFLTVLSDEDRYMPRKFWTEISKSTYRDIYSNRIFHFYSKVELFQELWDFQILNYDVIREKREPRGEEYIHSIIALKNE